MQLQIYVEFCRELRKYNPLNGTLAPLHTTVKTAWFGLSDTLPAVTTFLARSLMLSIDAGPLVSVSTAETTHISA